MKDPKSPDPGGPTPRAGLIEPADATRAVEIPRDLLEHARRAADRAREGVRRDETPADELTRAVQVPPELLEAARAAASGAPRSAREPPRSAVGARAVDGPAAESVDFVPEPGEVTAHSVIPPATLLALRLLANEDAGSSLKRDPSARVTPEAVEPRRQAEQDARPSPEASGSEASPEDASAHAAMVAALRGAVTAVVVVALLLGAYYSCE